MSFMALDNSMDSGMVTVTVSSSLDLTFFFGSFGFWDLVLFLSLSLFMVGLVEYLAGWLAS